MPIVNKTLPSLYNGVSKQSIELRLDSQVEEMVNCVPTLTNGIQRRQPLEFKSFGSTYGENSFYHKYDRGDNEEKYLVEILNNNIKVTDENGIEKTVNFEGDSKDYLNIEGDGYKSFAATTVGDTTFVVNKEKIVNSGDSVDSGNNSGGDNIDEDGNIELQYYWKIEDSITTRAYGSWIGLDSEQLLYINIEYLRSRYADTAGNDINTVFIDNITNDTIISFGSNISFEDALLKIAKDLWINYTLPYLENFYNNFNVKIIPIFSVSDITGLNRLYTTYTIYGLDDNYSNLPLYNNLIRIDGNHVPYSLIVTDYTNNPQSEFFPPDDNTEYSNIKNAYLWIKNTYNNGIKENITDSFGTEERYGGYDYYLNNIHINHFDSKVAIGRFMTYISLGNYSYTAEHRDTSVLKLSNINVNTFKWSDSFGDLASFGWIDEVESIQELPNMKGYFKSDEIIVKITGENSDYYVIWNDKTWEETFKRNEIVELDDTTMPHKLVREEDGTFTFSLIEWDERKVGDLDSNPLPSFIGETITDIFFFKNRLGLLAGTSMILSEIGSYFNFFINSVVDLLDSDFIDVGVAGSQVSKLEKAVTNNGELLLFASNGQYIVNKSGSLLTAEKMTIDKLSDYKYDVIAGIVSSANSLFFIDNTGNYNNVYQYIVDGNQSDITTHIPNYIIGDIKNMEISEKYKTLILEPDDENNTILYIYNWYFNGNEKAQSAWHKWDLSAELTSITTIYIFENILYISGDVASGQNNLYTINLEVVEDISDILYVDGGNQFESLIELSEFKVSTGNSGIKDNVGKIQIRNVDFLVSDKSKYNIEIKKEIGGTKTFEDSKSKLPILSNNHKVNIKFKNNFQNGFELNSLTYECLYKTISKGGI